MTNQPIEEKWKDEFETFMKGHDTITGGLDSGMIPDLKAFIENLLEQERKRMSDEIKKLEKERWPRAVYSDDILYIINK